MVGYISVEHFPMITSDQHSAQLCHFFEHEWLSGQSAQSALSSLAFAFLTIAAGTARAGLTLGANHYGLLSNFKAIQIRVSVQVILNLKNKKLFGGASCTGEFVSPSFSNILVTHAQLFSVRCHHN